MFTITDMIVPVDRIEAVRDMYHHPRRLGTTAGIASAFPVNSFAEFQVNPRNAVETRRQLQAHMKRSDGLIGNKQRQTDQFDFSIAGFTE